MSTLFRLPPDVVAPLREQQRLALAQAGRRPNLQALRRACQELTGEYSPGDWGVYSTTDVWFTPEDE